MKQSNPIVEVVDVKNTIACVRRADGSTELTQTRYVPTDVRIQYPKRMHHG